MPNVSSEQEQLNQQLLELNLPVNPEERLRGFRELYQNPFYLYLLAQLAQEEASETTTVFQGDVGNTNNHFRSVGLALGLVRIKDLHLGVIEDLRQQIKEQNED